MRESLSRQAEDAVGDVAEGTCPLCRVGLRIHDDRASAAITDARAAADREEALTVWLDQRGTGSSWRIAPILASSGVDVAWCERVGNVLTGDTVMLLAHVSMGAHQPFPQPYFFRVGAILRDSARRRPPTCVRRKVMQTDFQVRPRQYGAR